MTFSSDPDPDPRIRVWLMVQSFFAYYFWKYIYIIFQRSKTKRSHKNSRNQSFSYYFCLITGWSGSVSLTKNIQILRIRIRNTEYMYKYRNKPQSIVTRNSTRSYLIIKINAFIFKSKSFGHFIRWFKQGCGSVFIWYGSGSSIFGWIPIRIQLVWWPKIGKNVQLKKKLYFFGSKTTIYLSLGLHKGRPSYIRSLQLLKENIQHLKHEIS